ncbi:hypothetical protein FNF31_07572 [Cafeteria roenbergensis]|uniref:Uncharacterized protein n=2 Tax=Cafeteria roenbergensis TaxID=33653 RepID=A0A5A8C622_CAFRO|nr:hypothetical protein FNF31_07572 [Cafeteria roenbergensis]
MRHVLVLALALAALAPEAVSRPEGSSGRAGVHPGSRSGAAASAGAPQAPRLGPAPIDDAHTEAHLKPSRYAKLPPHNLAIPGVHPHAESSGTGPGAPPAAKGAREKAAPKAKPATLVFSTPDSLYAEATRGAAAEAVARAADAAAVAARKSGKDADSGSVQTESSLDVLRREGLGGAAGSSRGGSAPVDEGVVPGSPFASEAGADVEAFPLLDHLLSAADSGRLSETAATRALRGEADARSAGRRGELADLDAAAAVGIQQPTSLSALVKAVAADDTLAEGRAAAAPHGGLPSDPATGSVTSASDVTSPATALASVRDAMGLGNLVVTEAPVDDDLVLSLAARAAVADAVAADLLAPQAASHVAPVAAVVAGDAAAARPAPLRLGLVALLDLAPLANDRLPHEVEAFVGSLLGLARFVVLPKALPERRFFSFWSGAAALVEAAADKVGLVVTVRELGQPKSGSASSSASRWQSSSSSSSSSYPWGRNMGADNGRDAPGDEMPEPPKPSPDLVLVAVQTPEEAWAERAAFAAAKKRLGSAAASSGSAAQATPGSASPGSAGTASRPPYGSAAPPSPSSAGAGTASSGTAASAGSEAASSGAKAVERLRELGSFPARVALAAGHGADPAAAEAAVLSPASLGGTCVASLVRFTQSMVEAAVDDAIAGLEARAAALATPPSSPAQASLDPRKTASTASLWGTSGEQKLDPFGRPQTPIAVEAPHKRALKRLKTVKPHFVAAVTAALGAAGLSSAGPDSAAALAAGLWGQPLDPLPLGFPLDVLLAMGLGSSDKEGLFHQMVASGRVPAYSRPDRLQVTAYGVEGCGHHGSPSHPADSLPSLDADMGDEAKEAEEEGEEEEDVREPEALRTAALPSFGAERSGKAPSGQTPDSVFSSQPSTVGQSFPPNAATWGRAIRSAQPAAEAESEAKDTDSVPATLSSRGGFVGDEAGAYAPAAAPIGPSTPDRPTSRPFTAPSASGDAAEASSSSSARQAKPAAQDEGIPSSPHHSSRSGPEAGSDAGGAAVKAGTQSGRSAGSDAPSKTASNSADSYASTASSSAAPPPAGPASSASATKAAEGGLPPPSGKGLRGAAGGASRAGERRLLGLLEPAPWAREEAAAAGIIAAAAGSSPGAAAAIAASVGSPDGGHPSEPAWAPFRPADAGAGSPKRLSGWAKEHASVQSRVAAEQGSGLASLWPALQAELQPALSPEVGPGAAVLVAGDELSLLAAKIARAMPRAAVVALAQRPSSVDPTSRLASLLKLRNLLLARGRLTPARVNALAAVPDPFRLQVLGTGWTSLLLHAADAPEAAEAALGRVLRLASSTLLQLPAWPELASGLLSVRGGAASADMWAGSRGTAGTLAACVAAARARGADAALHGPLSASAACAWEVLSGVGGGDASQPEAGGMGQSADVPLEDILGAASAPGAAGVAAPSRVAAEERASARAESSFAQPGSGGSATTAADRLNTFRYGSAALSEHAALKARYDPSGDSSPVAADDPAAASAGRLGSVFASRAASADTPLARFRPLARLLARAARLAGLPHASFRFVTESAPARAAATAGARREADASQLFATGRVFLRVDVAPWARRDAPAAAPRAPPAFPLAVPVPATASTSSSSWPAAGPLLSASPGVSLHTLLVLGLVPAHRAEVFRMHLRLPLPLVAAASASMGWSPRPASAAAAPAGSPPAKAAGPASPAALAPWAVRFMPPATAAALQAVEPSAAAWMRLGADPLAAGPDAPGASSGAGAMSAAARAALEDAVRSSGAGRLAVLVVAPEAVSARAQAVAGGGSSKLGYLPARRLWVWSGNPAEEAATPEGGAEGALAWAAISSQLPRLDTASGGSAGKFSAIDLESGAGALSLRLAQAYPEATVVSVEQSATLTDLHLAAAMRRGLGNAVLCRKQVDPALVHSLYKSPEFLRFLTLGPDVLDLVRRHGLSGAGDLLGYAMGSAATSFLRTPEAASLSLAFTSLFHSYPDPDWIAPPAAWGTPHGRQSSRHASAGARAGSPYAAAGAGAGVGEHAAMAPLGGESAVVDPGFAGRFSLAFHPRPLFRRAEARILSSLAKPPGGKLHVAATPVMAALPVAPDWPAMGSGVIRVDVVNMSRHVNHHFQSEKDGHDRTYTLIVQGNATAHEALDQLAPAQRSDPRAVYRLLDKGNHPNGGGVVSVRLTRDKDKAAIPYVTVHGVTLITVLRLGLLAPLRARAYGQFVHLPLYQDMAPWNIVFLGADLDYIDFDTRDHTYDAVVPRAYEVMEVLFNYKRTVEDFKMCGGKAGNPYNFPYVSECVQSPDFSGPCKDSKVPVPCGDGRCHSDYVSCLRSMAEEADRKRGPGHWAGVGLEATDKAFRRQGLRGSAGAGETSEASLFEALQASLPPSIGAARAPEAHQTASAWLDSRAGRDARLAAHGRWEMRS